MAVATRSGAGPSTGDSRDAIVTFTVIGALILAGYFGLTYLYDRVKPSSEQIYESLAEAKFEQPLPDDLRVTGGSTNVRPGEGYVSVHLNTPIEPEGFDGPQARISYVVYEDVAQARSHFEEMKAAHHMQQGAHKVGGDKITSEVTTLGLAEQNFCVNGLGTFCDVLIDRVIIDISSNLEALGLGQDRYQQLADAALAHLREAVPGVG